MFGSNIFIGEPIGFFGRNHEDASGFGAEGKIHIRRSGWASLRGGIDPLANDFRLCLGNPKADRFFFAKQAQEQVLGFYLWRTIVAGFVACEEDHSTCLLGVTLKHRLLHRAYFPAGPLPI